MADEDGRPRWSITWLFRLQRHGRQQMPAGDSRPALGWFSWAVLLLLLVEVAVLVWLGLLPR